ncbi:hypothetical protein [Butyricicoccus sp.]|uniref:hypothetical protein n=1 Tax=Butyricicoccus sp. TaxID=2049021 RepID=UPI003F144C43
MKKKYEAPALEMEVYELDASIASHCGIVVSNGPAEGNHEQCEDYHDPFATSTYSAQKAAGPYNVQFYEDTNCDCYTTGGDYGYWTS